jgi:hypothetical protein
MKGRASEKLTAPSLTSTSGSVKLDQAKSATHDELVIPAASATIFDLT